MNNLAPAPTPKMPPKILKAFIWSYALLTLVWWAARFKTSPLSENIVNAALIAFSFLVLWNLWRGRNWARYVTFVLCALDLLSLCTLATQRTPLQSILMLIMATLDAALLVTLNTPHLRPYFSSP